MRTVPSLLALPARSHYQVPISLPVLLPSTSHLYITHQRTLDGALGLVLWSTTEPAVALICSCLPVMRPLYTTGLKRLGSSRGWTWNMSKRSKTSDYSTGSSGQDKEDSNMTGSTLRSPITTKTKNDKFYWKITDAEISGPYQEMHSPNLPLDKPLPPAYSPRQEEDTGYHTWSWNLLSRPRSENKAPKLTRSPTVRDSAVPWRSPISPETGVRTTVSGGKWSNKITPIHLKTKSPPPTKFPYPRRQFDNWSSLPDNARTSLSQKRPPLQIPKGGATISAPPPSPAPLRHVAKCDVRHRSIAGSPDGGFILPPKPRSVARTENEERIKPPKLTVRTADDSSPPLGSSPPKFSSPTAYKGWDRGPRDGTGDMSGERLLPNMRPVSNLTIWPSREGNVTERDVEVAVGKGLAV